MPKVWRFAPVVALATAIGLMIAGVGLALYIDRINAARKINEITVQARILASTVTAALAFNDAKAGQEYVDAIRVNPEIQYAGIYDAGGKLFAGYPRGAAPRLIPEAAKGLHVGKGVLDVAVPVVQDGVPLGTVDLRTGTEPLAFRAVRYGVIALLVAMAALVVGVLGLAQAALARANRALESRAADLAEANQSLRDEIAQREKAEEALRQSQKMEAIGQLTGGLAHDFNNLLAGIMGSLELMQTRALQGRAADVARYVEMAMQSARRAAALTHRLLAFSRRQTLDPKPVDPNRLVSGMKELIDRTVGPAIHVEAVLPRDAWGTLCDPNQLENALLNLAINARDAMPEGGRLTIETANVRLDDAGTETGAKPGAENGTPDEYVAIRVADTGAGMPPEVIERAFDPFFTTKPIGQGTGLGLSMIYGFVKQSRGHVRIDSKVGHGTTVRLYLPRHRDEAEAEAAPHAAADAPRAAPGETVLVVDDEPVVRMLVVEVLNELGYAAMEAADGPEALRLLQSSRRIDLLVTDVGLPNGMNGRQLADAARVVRRNLRVLFITGYAENAAVGGGQLEPGMEVMSKPFAMDALAAKIRGMIEAARPVPSG